MSKTLWGRGAHKLRAGVKKTMATAAAVAVASTVVIGAFAAPSSAGIIDIPFPGQVKPGYQVYPALQWNNGHDIGTWFGALKNFSDEEFYAWCIQAGIAAPSSAAELGSPNTLSGNSKDLGQPANQRISVAEFAYLLEKYEKASNADSRAALGYLVHTNFEISSSGSSTGTITAAQKVPQIVATVKRELPDVFALATQYVAEAKQNVPTDYTGATPEGDGQRTGKVNGIGIQTAGGGWQAGKKVTVTLEGPAVFKINNSKTWSGTTGTTPISLEWIGTGNGEVTVGTRFEKVTRKTLTRYDSKGWVQETISYGDRPGHADPESTTGPNRKFNVISDFQPEVTTQVANKFISKGDAFLDNVTMSGVDWVEIDGKPVSIIAKGTLYGPFASPQTPAEDAPAGAPVAGTAELTFDGPGTKSAGADITATGSGYFSWKWDINKADQGDNAQYVRDNYTDGFFTVGETTIVKTTPEVVTERDERIVEIGDSLIDNVTVTLPEGDIWTTDESGDPVAIPVTVTSYGPFDVPQERSSEVPSGAPVAGVEELVFTEPGTQKTSGAVKATAEGFYTWVAVGAGTEFSESFTHDFMVEVETSTVRYGLEHFSQAREYNVVPGGRAFDTITIKGFPQSHGTFEGLGEWVADGTLADVTVYGPMLEAPSTEEVPADAPVFMTTQIPAKDGVFNVGYTQDDIVSPTEGGHYVFVYSFDGDDRTAPFTSDFNDVLEQFYVPVTPTPELPVQVVTQATPEVEVGKPFKDTALVTGNTKDGDYLVFEAFGPQQPGEAPVCEEPFFTSEKIAVDGAGYYESGETTIDKAGNVYWVETLFDKDGKGLHKGKCGIPSETTKVIEKPWVTTKAISDSGDAPVIGDDIWDTIQIGGTFPEGSYTVVDLFFTEGTINDLVCEDPIWTSDKIEIEDGKFDYITGKYTTTKAGVYSFVEQTFDKDGELISAGLCGEPSETLVITEKPWVTTKATSDNGDEPIAGDDIWDTIQIGGTFPEGSYTEVSLYYSSTTIDDLTCDTSIWTSKRIEIVNGVTEYATDKFTTEADKDGVYSFLERTYNKDGELISEGECGEPSETLIVKGGAKDEGGKGDLAVTGFGGVLAAVGGATLLAAGAGATIISRRRKADNA